jgi:hypothetical protein
VARLARRHAAEFVDLWSPAPRAESARAAIERLVERVHGHAERLGDAAELERIGALLDRGSPRTPCAGWRGRTGAT